MHLLPAWYHHSDSQRHRGWCDCYNISVCAWIITQLLPIPWAVARPWQHPMCTVPTRAWTAKAVLCSWQLRPAAQSHKPVRVPDGRRWYFTRLCMQRQGGPQDCCGIYSHKWCDLLQVSVCLQARNLQTGPPRQVVIPQPSEHQNQAQHPSDNHRWYGPTCLWPQDWPSILACYQFGGPKELGQNTG